MIRIMNVYIDRNSNLKVFDILGISRFPWSQIEIYKRKNGQITEVWIFFLNFIIAVRFNSILKDVKKWTKQGYMPSFENWKVTRIIQWPKNIKIKN